MEKEKLLRDIRELLFRENFEIGEPILKSISFDMIARRDDLILILKALVNIDALRAEVARELKILGKELKAAPIVIGKRNAMGEIMDDVVYSRHGLPILSFNTFKNFIVNGEYPMVYASPGGLYVNINGWLLRRVREARGISLGELAKIAGVSRKAIQLYEEGMNATIDSALRLEDYLGIPLIEPIDILDLRRLKEERYENIEDVDDIYRRLMKIGYDVFLTIKCPFEALSKDERDVFLTSIGKNQKKLKVKAMNLRIFTELLGKNAFIVVNKAKYEEIDGIPLIERSEIMEIESKEEIRKIVRERSAI
ncbi:transcriptional regulator [Candidatus Aciduliprofundum boonei]|uniref:Transcriptional regulator, XRE family n=1 Tax=Aciduliprofundum boonei (strain DSM 19572 / T469) TaxID=439481 RepID=B5IB04_ACIB4|nr:transcriptional regulator [Candidatus Aciduliprofundum boonei]ADD09139.1 transcriptional regulator, XRE family [Aciduliprofundum boonei T469]EDY35936.1 Helix-turn-helix domain protein [Aciduliprofundum boonei T469]EDY36405.1 Helix-turn-helix domain protein [Aciduliprofundum boonei T469]HII55391.1 transcriptional regulator [Candidatus Aciduliprofundum boonei]